MDKTENKQEQEVKKIKLTKGDSTVECIEGTEQFFLDQGYKAEDTKKETKAATSNTPTA